MKVILHLATSADGFIAKPDGDSRWVSAADEALFQKRCKEAGCVVVGKRTYEQYKEHIYPVEGAITIVLSTQAAPTHEPTVLIVSSPREALHIASEKGCTSVLIAGGGKTSSAFLQEGLLDEVFLSVHPLLLGEGIRWLDGAQEMKLNLIDCEQTPDFVQLHYAVPRSK